jgi:hypothetical protein
MIYVSYGVTKSASSFTYVVTETVLKTAGYAPVALSEAIKGGKSRLNYIAAISWNAVERVVSAIGERTAVIKTHAAPDKRLLEAIERGEVFASAVIRDPREIALSLLDHAKRSRRLGIADFAEFESVTDTFKVLDDQIKRLARWMESNKVLLLTYDEISFDTESAVQRIIEQLGISVSPAAVIAALPDRGKIIQFNKGVRSRYESEMPVETQQIFLKRYADVYRRYLGGDPVQKAPTLWQEATVPATIPPSYIDAPGKDGHGQPTPAAVENSLALHFVCALYRVLMFREPNAIELDAHVRRILIGSPVENIMRELLRSQEFAGKHTRFLETYVFLAPYEGSQPELAKTGAAAAAAISSRSDRPVEQTQSPNTESAVTAPVTKR